MSSFDPDKNLPGCMMPDGGECCEAYAALYADWKRIKGCLAQSPAPATQVREALEDMLVTMRHARVFITSREKMHPEGVKLWDELFQKIEVLAALPQPGALEPWQLIETAPKDGARILVCNVERFPKKTYVVRWLDDAWQISPMGEWTSNPTHWMPLPEGPRK